MQDRLTDVKVVIVDDDPDIRDSMQAAFEAEGADVVTASDGNAGVDAYREHEPDLMILDMMLPGRSGFLALEKIKGEEKSPLVVMVTANDGRRHQAYAESLGVDAYMIKPVPLTTLIDQAEALIRQQREEDAATGTG
jgi:DNA-binding response OmpR family regulator